LNDVEVREQKRLEELIAEKNAAELANDSERDRII